MTEDEMTAGVHAIISHQPFNESNLGALKDVIRWAYEIGFERGECEGYERGYDNGFTEGR